MKLEENRKKLVESLKKQGIIKSKEIQNAFLEIPREKFISSIFEKHAYLDTPLEIGQGQTISAPHMIAIMCEELDLKKGQKILEIGTGLGYHAAIVAKIIEPDGCVYTIERHENLAEKAKQNLKNINIKNVTVEIGDGSEGLVKYAPYDRIYVTCAAPSIPQPLIEQLKDPGKMLIPVGNTICTLVLVEKNNGKIKKENHGGCAFVPLIGKYGH
jgi:protein-L-isoaspartate(D-aspartate) O-methyltransferase